MSPSEVLKRGAYVKILKGDHAGEYGVIIATVNGGLVRPYYRVHIEGVPGMYTQIPCPAEYLEAEEECDVAL